MYLSLSFQQAGLCGTPSIEKIAVVSRSVRSQKQKLKVTYPERLSLAFEPEAASFYCRNMKDHDIAEYCKPAAQIPVIDKYIVVDIGAGTADISAHGVTSEGNIEVLTPPEGNLHGGVAVNKEFEYFLSRLVCDPDFSTYTSSVDEAVNAARTLNVRNIIYTNFEEEKTQFGEHYMSRYMDKMIDPVHETFNVKLYDFYDFYLERLQRGIHRLNSKDDGKVTLKNKMLVIHYSQMEEFFDHPVQKILIILKNCLERLDNKVHTIFLVGGFGGCQYMYYRVEEALKQLYGPNGFRIIVPEHPHLAVVEGAFEYRKNPQLVRSRVAKATYGTEGLSSFDYKIHDSKYLHTTRFGIHKCKYLFSPLIIEGEQVEFDKVKRNIFYPTEPHHTCIGFELLVTNKKDLFYTRDPNGDLKDGVKVLGTISLPSPNTVQGTDRKMYLTFDFSHTEIQVRAYDESSDTERRAVIDCLQRQP